MPDGLFLILVLHSKSHPLANREQERLSIGKICPVSFWNTPRDCSEEAKNLVVVALDHCECWGVPLNLAVEIAYFGPVFVWALVKDLQINGSAAQPLRE